MKNLAPDITRQRLLIEGFYEVDADKSVIVEYFNEITVALGLRMYGEPIVFSPGGEGKEENQGYDAFVPLIDSGISLYVWSNSKFLSLVIYTCKSFDENKALEVTKKFWGINETESQSF
jgi:S-adenosylmethionine decarboxylase